MTYSPTVPGRGAASYKLRPLIFEFKKEGIVVGIVKAMANCRKKPSLWLPLFLSPIYATPFRACVSLHKCRTRVVPVGGSCWGTHADWLQVDLLENFPLMAITRQCWTRVNPLMLIHGRGRGKQHIDKFGNLFTTDYPAKEMNMNGNNESNSRPTRASCNLSRLLCKWTCIYKPRDLGEKIKFQLSEKKPFFL